MCLARKLANIPIKDLSTMSVGILYLGIDWCIFDPRPHKDYLQSRITTNTFQRI